MIKGIKHSENLHILLWLVKDTFWCLAMRVPGLIMIVPTVFLAIYITWEKKNIPTAFAHNLAVCFWIGANSIWMIGEFYYDDGLRNYSLAFFFSGLITLSIFYGGVMMGKFNHNGETGTL